MFTRFEYHGLTCKRVRERGGEEGLLLRDWRDVKCCRGVVILVGVTRSMEQMVPKNENLQLKKLRIGCSLVLGK
jgi:hypothetical protein